MFAITVFLFLATERCLCGWTTTARYNYANDVLKPPYRWDRNYSSPLYRYTKPALSLKGEECVGDCVDGLCVVNMEGLLATCRVESGKAPKVYYTARYRQPGHTKCTSACVGVDTRCFVNDRGDWDHCNPQWQTTQSYPKVIRSPGSDFDHSCASSCVYSESATRYQCRTRALYEMCAPFADVSPFVLRSESIDFTSNALGKCVSQPSLRSSNCNNRMKRMDESDTEYEEDVCLAADNPDLADHFRGDDASATFNNLPAGTVAADASAYRSLGNHHINPQPPLTSVTTVHNTALNIDLPTVVRARIDAVALDSVVLPRPSDGIRNAVPSLVTALHTVRYSVNGIPYDVGHMVAYNSNGPDESYNFAPQSATLNRGLWLSMERHIRNWVNDNRPGGFVDMLIVVYYDPGVTYLPLAFGVNLAYYFAEGQVASLCNDMVYFNHNNRRRGRRSAAPPLQDDHHI